jgi:lysophospholipase L1-like esterase
MTGKFEGTGLRTNEHGMRGESCSIECEPGTVRIAIIGDSFTFGWGVEERESFVTMLEARLERQYPGRRFEVLNFGVPGYNTAMECATLEHKALKFRPDFVILQFYYNDDRLPILVAKKPRRPDWCLIHQCQRIFQRATTPSDGSHEVGLELRDDPEFVPEEYAHIVGKPAVVRFLTRMKQLCDRAGIPFVVAILAMPEQATLRHPVAESDYGPREGWFAEECTRLSIPTINLYHALAESLRISDQSPKDIMIENDLHANAKGHVFIVRAIADFLIGHPAIAR